MPLRVALQWIGRLLAYLEPEWMLIWRHPSFAYHLLRLNRLKHAPQRKLVPLEACYYLFWSFLILRSLAAYYALHCEWHAYFQVDYFFWILTANGATVPELFLVCTFISFYFICAYRWAHIHRDTIQTFVVLLVKLTVEDVANFWQHHSQQLSFNRNHPLDSIRILLDQHRRLWKTNLSSSSSSSKHIDLTINFSQAKLVALVQRFDLFFYFWSFLLVFLVTSLLVVFNLILESTHPLVLVDVAILFIFVYCTYTYATVAAFGCLTFNSLVIWNNRHVTNRLNHMTHHQTTPTYCWPRVFRIYERHAHLVYQINCVISPLCLGLFLANFPSNASLASLLLISHQLSTNYRVIFATILLLQATEFLWIYFILVPVNRVFASRSQNLHRIQVDLRQPILAKLKFATQYELTYHRPLQHGYTLGVLGLATNQCFFELIFIYIGFLLYFGALTNKHRLQLIGFAFD